MDAEGQSFALLLQKANNSLYDLGGQLQKTQKLSNRGNDTVLARGIADLGKQTSETTKLVQSATQLSGLSGAQLQQQNVLGEEFDALLHRVREIQASISARLKKRQQQQQAETNRATETTPLVQSDGQVQVQQQVLDQLDQAEVDLHSSLIDSRDAEIAEVQRGAREINAIFQDIGVLVTEQRQQLDTVEDHITNLATQTENAGRQLVRAEQHQRSRGKWTCIALCVLLVITILVAVSVIN